jgi:hypothetical protein
LRFAGVIDGGIEQWERSFSASGGESIFACDVELNSYRRDHARLARPAMDVPVMQEITSDMSVTIEVLH